MADLTNDPQLIGFWPLDEPSGAPYFKNYSISYGNKPSGISFDFHVCQGNATTNAAVVEWPGQALATESGAFEYRGLQLHGTYQSAIATGRHTKYLVLGRDVEPNQKLTLGGPIAQSGFTFGIWVLPRSNGYQEYVDGATTNGTKQQALGNAVFFRGDDDFNIMIGVSGDLDGGAQYNALEFGGPHRLTGYAYIGGLDTDNPITGSTARILETPIESGHYVHLACTYRYIDGSINEVVLYKDGRVEASGTTDRGLTFPVPASPAGNDFDSVPWSIGGTVENGDTSPTIYDLSNGWNHLVSGAYLFNRVLHEGEILEIHQRGGLQVSQGNIGSAANSIVINDDRLVGYWPMMAVGLADVSSNHRPLIAPHDEGDRSSFGAYGGPLRTGGYYKFNVNAGLLAATSGTTFDLAGASAGFTIGLRYHHSSIEQYDDNVVFSFGTCGTTLNPAVANSTNGIRISRDTGVTGSNIFADFFPIGDENTLTRLVSHEANPGHNINSHVAIVYSAADDGVALYVDGEFHASGTVSNPLGPHLLNLAGSGFPITFLGGISADDPFTEASVSNRVYVGDISAFSSPLRADEIRSLAQSGINTVPLQRTPNDPRLAGYWPCTEFDGDDIFIQDRATLWQTLAPGHLRFSLNDRNWDDLVLTDTGGPWYTTDYFLSQNRPTVPELESFGPLGITSGAWTVNTQGSRSFAANDNAKSSIVNYMTRWRVNPEDNDIICVHPYGEYIMMFDVTPSGTIPLSLEFAENSEFNSVLYTFTDGTDQMMSYLTTVDAAQGSGVSIVFMGNEVTDREAHVSGVLPYGVPSHIMVHIAWDDPNNEALTVAAGTFITMKLYINGVYQMERRMESQNAKLWPDQQSSAAGDVWMLNIGGLAIDESEVLHAANAETVGLGDNHIRNFTLLRGSFTPDDVLYFASSGVSNTSPLAGFSDGSIPTTQVTIADSALEGYWRFSGQPSGETDLSLKGNDLVSLAKQAIEDGVFTPGSNTEPAYNLRYVPGPLALSDLVVQASGITYNNDAPTTNPIAPYVASGVAFQDPGAGFSIGLWLLRREIVAASDADVLMAYGVIDTLIGQTNVQDNAGWAIFLDEDDSVRMVVSSAGNMHLDDIPNAANSGMVTAGAAGNLNQAVLSPYEDWRYGSYHVGSLDSWHHYMWTYDPTTKLLTCYQDGIQVDQKEAPERTNLHGPVHNPIDPSARLITFYIHQEDASAASVPWGFGTTRSSNTTHMTDVCYFTRALTQREVTYIAQNGIDAAVGTETSGVIGGFVHGQDTGSGHVGGYLRGQDTGSGHIGGYIPGGMLGSGSLGGYVSGVIFGTGTIGGWIQGLDDVSGILAGYIRGVEVGSGSIAGYIAGQDVGSGHFGGLIFAAEIPSGLMGGFMTAADIGSGLVGGFMLGGLQSLFEFDAGYTVEVLAAEDFDAQLEIAKTVFSDFDAKVVIFQNEVPPLVDIIIPEITVSGLAPPFNQYFIGKASGQQGKTITSTRWTFGDFTPPQTVAESGAGCYPIQHYYAASGFYIAKFEAIDSDGLHASATRIINAASGIDPVIVSLSGVPRSGDAELIVDFTTTVDILPPGVSLSAKLLTFDDGQTTISFNPTHAYTQPGTYKPIWCVRDSRGVIWCDSLEAGNDYFERGF